MHILAAVFLLFSGIAALTYQVTWVRLLGLSMGSTSASISTVLAAFFLGLALGSFLAERLSRNRIHSFKPYILLEVIIGISGLILLPTLLNLDSLITASPAFGSSLFYKFVVTMGLLLLPTVAMGATFPVMAAILVRREKEVGERISQLYSLNTLGAVLGALLSGFVFIPQWGLDGAIYIAVVLNLTVAALAFWFDKKIQLPALETTSPARADFTSAPNHGHRQLALAVLFVTGFVSIATEVGWTKYLAIFTGTTIYGFAAILAVFLIGIASGSWFIKTRIARIKNPPMWLALGLVITGFALLLTRGGLSLVPSVYEGINHMSVSVITQQTIKYLFIFVLLFIPTFLFGAIFPLNIKLYCSDLSGVQARVGRAYAVNTLASIFGSIAAGFWLIPQVGTDAMLTGLGISLIIAPLFFIVYIREPFYRFALGTSVTVFLLLQFALPHISYKTLISSVDYIYDTDAMQGADPEFLFIKEGKAGVISLVTHDGRYAKVQANGLNESIIDMELPDHALLVESLLAYVPFFFHENPRDAFIVGYGGGITTRAFTHTTVENIRVVELEPAVVDAAYAIPNGPVQALTDPRINLSFNDARNTLLFEEKKYDIIAAQPSHPWLAGASNVFTEEFWRIVHSRLNDDGIFTQWINLFRMDVTTLKSLLKAFYNVFPNGMSFANLDTGDFMLVGAKQPLVYDEQQIAQRMKLKPVQNALSYYEVYDAKDLLWYFALSRDEAVAASTDATPNRDTNIISEVRLSAMENVPPDHENPYTFLYDVYQFDIDDYLPQGQDLASFLFESGGLFLKWESPKTAEKIRARLDNISPVHARSLKHAWMVWHNNVDMASAWYETEQEWLDETHRAQMAIYLATDKRQLASETLSRIQHPQARRAANMELLYKTGNWEQLLAYTPRTDDEKKWWLLALADKDIEQAGAQLDVLVDERSHDIDQLRTLVRYHAAKHNDREMDKRQRQLIAHLDTLVERYKNLTQDALQANNYQWASHLVDSIRELLPNDEELPILESKLAAIQDKDTLAQIVDN